MDRIELRFVFRGLRMIRFIGFRVFRFVFVCFGFMGYGGKVFRG